MSQVPNPHRPLQNHWLRVAFAQDGGDLSVAQAFPPGSTVRVGSNAGNEVVIPEAGFGTRLAVSEGDLLHLTATSEVRMSAPGGAEFQVVRAAGSVRTVRAVVEKVHFLIHPGLSLFIHYHATRSEMDRFK